ncbi:MAG: ornithine carbamoyltransferase [Chloroflexota bacterium]
MNKDLLSVSDLSSEEIYSLIREAADLKSQGWLQALRGKVLALLFEKPSLRTRVSFEVAMRQLGGDSLYLSPAEVGLGKRESIPDVARVLERYVDVIAARTFSHQTLESLAASSRIPVINALSDLEHPCQALADLLTVYEKRGSLEDINLAFIGDGNNVSHSLLLAAALTGMNFRIASPPGYEVQTAIRQKAAEYASLSGAELLYTGEPQVAVAGADVVYTDVWTSMGQEAEAEKRRQAFQGYQVSSSLLASAKGEAIVMHPLPAHRGEEITDEVLDGPQSAVFDQAENRLHLQKALLMRMLGGLDIPLAPYR